MKLSRRALLTAGLGATQLGLLEKFGMNRARAGIVGRADEAFIDLDPGGLHHEQIWCPFTDAGIAKFIPPPAGGDEPYFYNAQMVKNYDGTTGNDGPYQKIRGPIWWNPKDPGMNDLQTKNPDSGGALVYVPYGYSWVSKDLGNVPVYERAVIMHGIDQGTAAHGSGIIASMCGCAGSDFRAPAIAAVVASAMMSRFPDRPSPSVNLGSVTPKAISTAANPISSAANAVLLNDVQGLEHMVSDHPDSAWAGLRKRHNIDELGFDGKPTGKQLPVTVVDERVLRATREMQGRSSAATDALYKELYDTYGGVSKMLAQDVVKTIGNTKGVEHLPDPIPWTPTVPGHFGYTTGYADGGSYSFWDDEFDLVLRLLKADLATSITCSAFGAGFFSFDSHNPPAAPKHVPNLRGVMDVLGRLLIEMSLTPSSTPGKSLLDDTQVHIFSDFGRTFLAGHPTSGSDHHPVTSMIMVGGNVTGNRMIGGYDETMSGSPLGVPVDIIDIEEGGKTTNSAVPRAADAAATVLRGFGLEAGKDFFIPGGYGEIAGVLK